MNLEIWIRGQRLELYTDTNVKQTIQANDLHEVRDRQANLTNQFSVPKTPANTLLFDGLGIASDLSRAPYEKLDCQIKIGGFDFITQGVAMVTETDENYKVHVYSGIVNFFKAIENRTIGEIITAEMNHEKNLATVVASFSKLEYKYLITDFNGLTHYQNALSEDVINIDYLVPCISVPWLWDFIHAKFGFAYSGSVFENPDFKDRYITYSKYVSVNDTTPILEDAPGEMHYYIDAGPYQTVWNIPPGTVTQNGKYRIAAEVTLDFEASNPGKKVYFYATINGRRDFPDMPFTNSVYLGESYAQDGTINLETILDLNIGDDVKIYVSGAEITKVTYLNILLSVDLDFINPGVVDFNTGMADLLVTTFVKEILVQYGLTMVAENGGVKYLTLEDRINNAEVVDWTSKYVQRTSETYLYGSYAQRNYFRYQYDQKDAAYHDGRISIINTNLDEIKTVYQSFAHSPELQLEPFNFGGTIRLTRKFKMYEREVKELADGTEEVTYKGFENRFYFLRESGLKYSGKIGSQTFNEEQDVANIPTATFTGLDWVSALKKYYGAFGQIVNDARIHEMALDLSTIDALTLDINKLYYFAQEAQHYLINRITVSGDRATAEMVRVKTYYDYTIIDDGEESDDTALSIAIRWGDNTTANKTGTAANITTRIAIVEAPVNNLFTSFSWQTSGDGVTWFDTGSDANPFTLVLIAGANFARLKGTAADLTEVYSNVLQYDKIVCRRYQLGGYGSSGDSIVFSFLDCNGTYHEYEIFSDYAASISGENGISFWIGSGPFCAIEGSVNYSRGNLEVLGLCT